MTCSTNCNYRTAATLHTLEVWFVLGIYLQITCKKVIMRIITIIIIIVLLVSVIMPLWEPSQIIGQVTRCTAEKELQLASRQKHNSPKRIGQGIQPFVGADSFGKIYSA